MIDFAGNNIVPGAFVVFPDRVAAILGLRVGLVTKIEGRKICMVSARPWDDPEVTFTTKNDRVCVIDNLPADLEKMLVNAAAELEEP